MPEDPENLVLHQLRELRADINRKFDAIMEELHDMRVEMAADRGRVASTDLRMQQNVEPLIQTMQRRLLRTDGRVDDLTKRLSALEPEG